MAREIILSSHPDAHTTEVRPLGRLNVLVIKRYANGMIVNSIELSTAGKELEKIENLENSLEPHKDYSFFRFGAIDSQRRRLRRK